MTDETSTSVPATLARIDERTRRTEEDVKQLIAGQVIFATRREHDALHTRVDLLADGFAKRVEKIEDKQHKTLWGFAAGAAALVGTYIFGKL
jgi:hypothetical protein